MWSSVFLERCVEALRQTLPDQYKSFQTRSMRTLVKLYFDNPAIHYEIWLRKEHYVELGLHFEADKATNERWLRHFSDHALDVVSQLGPQVEIEQWTQSWGRVHQTLPFGTPDERLLATVVARMAAMITVLQPLFHQPDADEAAVDQSKTEET